MSALPAHRSVTQLVNDWIEELEAVQSGDPGRLHSVRKRTLLAGAQALAKIARERGVDPHAFLPVLELWAKDVVRAWPSQDADGGLHHLVRELAAALGEPVKA